MKLSERGVFREEQICVGRIRLERQDSGVGVTGIVVRQRGGRNGFVGHPSGWESQKDLLLILQQLLRLDSRRSESSRSRWSRGWNGCCIKDGRSGRVHSYDLWRLRWCRWWSDKLLQLLRFLELNHWTRNLRRRLLLLLDLLNANDPFLKLTLGQKTFTQKNYSEDCHKIVPKVIQAALVCIPIQ